MTATVARTARTAHHCEWCRRQTIRPGHRYLRHTAFPDGETNTTDRPYSINECVACATGRDETADILAGACGSFCHGVTPCALPVRHGNDHSCRVCACDSAVLEAAVLG